MKTNNRPGIIAKSTKKYLPPIHAAYSKPRDALSCCDHREIHVGVAPDRAVIDLWSPFAGAREDSELTLAHRGGVLLPPRALDALIDSLERVRSELGSCERGPEANVRTPIGDAISWKKGAVRVFMSKQLRVELEIDRDGVRTTVPLGPGASTQLARSLDAASVQVSKAIDAAIAAKRGEAAE